MKRISLLILTTIVCCAVQCVAQPSSVKDAAKSVFRLTTYKADGSVLSESNGIFISADGTAVSSLKPFLGAARATITDTKGKHGEVSRILGTNEIYDMAKFKVENIKPVAVNLASTPAKSGDEVWLATYHENGAKPLSTTVKSVETFMGEYYYYIFTMQAPEKSDASPFLNSQGQVIGLLKPSATSTDTHATDANLALSLHTTGFALNDPIMRQIGIPPALPEEQEQALLILMMAESEDSVKHAAVVNDFMAQYPKLVDGYSAKARMQVAVNDFKGATKTMEAAIKQADKKDEAHAAYGKIIYDKLVFKADVPYTDWTLDKAEEETNQAYAINQLPAYQHQQAQITFAKGDYQKAYGEFTQLLNTSMHNPELFYEAAQCKTMMKAPQQEIIALLDSAINNTDTLRIREAAPYFLARADAYNAIDSFRQAVFDYTRYEILSGQRMNSQFYYIRSQAEIKARLYQQALGDLAAAIMLSPEEPTYYAEMASLQLRVNMNDEALETATRCVKLAPEYSDGYLLLGLAQIRKGDTAAGLPNLEKAKELGNPQAQPLIDKYSK